MNKLEKLNKELDGKSPQEVVEFVLKQSQNPVITTNFRPYEVAILHLITSVEPDIQVVWCDTGYNTPNTYKHAEKCINDLSLNIQTFVPKQTVAHRNSIMGIPDVSDPNHALFTEQVKLEPFNRAMKMLKPDLWFTNIRSGQTSFRSELNICSESKDGLLKVSPFFNFSDSELDTYLEKHKLENEFKYYDPTKALETRECGLHQ